MYEIAATDILNEQGAWADGPLRLLGKTCGIPLDHTGFPLSFYRFYYRDN